MKRISSMVVLGCLCVIGLTTVAGATVIDFTGGTATLWDGSTVVPNNSGVWGAPGAGLVDYYTEGGFGLDFIGDYGIIGDYYGAGNDVIHGHWATGSFGSLTSIVAAKLDGTTFDLNYFVLTSNTEFGGGAASGNEETWFTASNGYTLKLPPEDWGFPSQQIYLGGNCNDISWFQYTVTDHVDCFGMDNFYIDEAAPPPEGVVPEASTWLLLGTGLAGLVAFRKRIRSA
jgi:hypothetical protein